MKIKALLVGVVTALLMTSCAMEVKIAKQFVSQKPLKAAVYFPETAKVTLIQNEEGEYTKVLDSLNQDAFLDILYASYVEAMGRFGVEVYVPESADAVPVDSTQWLVLLSQMEIQGLFTDYVDYYYDLVDEYEYTFPLNTVNVASWFDINDGEWHPTVFCEHNLRDDFSSKVVRGTGGYQYYYESKTITLEDVYNYAVFLGQLYADYTYNDMMNRYIKGQMGKKNLEPRFRLRWDPEERSFYFQEEEEGFVEIEN